LSGNGPSSSSAGYHYLGAEGDGSVVSNPYAATLAVLASVMAKLNGGHPLKAYGFGATPAGSKSAPPLFSLKSPSSASGTKDVEVDDAAALVDAYRASAASVTPMTSREYAPVLREALSSVAADGNVSQDNQHYTLLALLTCGPMDDVEATVNELLASTQTALTVLVVGMGSDEATINARFATVRTLDEQIAGLHTKKVMALRDNLTFVPMPADRPPVDTAAQLASVSLTSGCDQLVNFMQMRDIAPGAAPGSGVVRTKSGAPAAPVKESAPAAAATPVKEAAPAAPAAAKAVEAAAPAAAAAAAPVAAAPPSPPRKIDHSSTQAFLDSLALDLEMKEGGDEEGVDSIRLQMSAKNLDKNHSFSSANPYVVISQVRPDGSRVRVFQTSVVNGSQNPSWPASNVYLPLCATMTTHSP